MTVINVADDAITGVDGDPRERTSGAASRLLYRYSLVVAWAGVIVIFSLLEPDRYFSLTTFASILNSQSVLVLIAAAQLIPLVAGHFDLSPAASAALSNVLVAEMVLDFGWPLPVAIAVVFAIAIVIAALNALLVVGLGVESLIVTLGAFTLLGGATTAVNPSPTGGYNGALSDFLTHKVLGLQLAFWLVVVVFAVLWFWLKHLPSGRRMHFVGFNPEVARLSGIRSARLRFASFLIAGFLSAASGVMLFGILGGGNPAIGSSMLFPAITAVILGSTAITPGVYNVAGTFVAVYLLMFGITGLELLGYTGWVPQVFFGGALVVAVVVSNVMGRSVLKT